MRYPNLKAELARHNMTGIEAAQLLGVTNVAFSRWCNGKGEPSIKQALKLAEALECDVTYLFQEGEKGDK